MLPKPAFATIRMAAITRLLLLILLVLLQSLAPLVHAHTSNGLAYRGTANTGKLHIPGLENYTSAGTANPSIVSASAIPPDSFIVSINTGIKQDPKIPNDSGLPFNNGIAPEPPVHRLIGHNRRLSQPLLFDSTRILAHSPRAPPAQAKTN